MEHSMPPKKIAVVEKPHVADELVTEAEYRRILLSQMRASPDNRKRFSELGLTELAASIKAMGVVQPILIRPVTPTVGQPEIYEIVAGERRYRASIIAGLLDIPTMVRVLNDNDAAKIRILENLQREDPHPIEEAEGFQMLMLRHGYNADQLAEEIKKSRAHVYARLKLCDLTPEVRDMVFDGVIPTSTALLIARIPVPGLQIKALHAIVRPDTLSGEQLSVRQAAEYISHHFMLDLKTAVFKIADANLFPAAGPCTTCPKRAGNQPEVYQGISADVCTDPVCFVEKKAAHHAAIVDAAIKKGIQVAEGEERSHILLNRWTTTADYVRPDANVFQFQRNAPATKNSGTPLSILGATGLPQVALYTKDDDGTTLAWYKRSDMQAALEAAGACESVEQHAARIASLRDDGQQTVASKDKSVTMLEQCPHTKKANEENAFRLALYKMLRAKGAASGFTLDSLRAFTKRAVWAMPLPDDLLGDVYDFDTTNETTVCEYVDRAGLPEIQLLLIDLVVGESLWTERGAVQNGRHMQDGFHTVVTMAEHEGIDAEALREAMFPSPINVDTVTIGGLTNFITKYPHRINELKDVVLAHPRFELIKMLERAATECGYVYTREGFEKLPPLLVGEGVNASLTEIPASSVVIDEIHRSADDTFGDEFLQTMMEEPPKPEKGKGKAKPATTPVKLTPAAAWPFPKSSTQVTA
jgi:ParB/RepB/Spo0J family partition protein